MVYTSTSRARSAQMARVRSRGNKSTELAVANILTQEGIRCWINHYSELSGTPDFYFKKARLAVFVNGCFWHACGRCGRRLPKSRTHFWKTKIAGNKRRDLRVRRNLWKMGIHSMIIWEHGIRKKEWLHRLRRMLVAGERVSAGRGK